ncbi:hypothetical protein RHGRI_036761 [Rhododendron griersonianum]|uniref:Uncharacterized protein n=1 Tax=Rhododendron griersonianum TaxID=479676 RepID=A0AAV6HS43_9ERIC|nr:hypothetical protein RHGRI_036761 [Rhododendron griersonianum]
MEYASKQTIPFENQNPNRSDQCSTEKSVFPNTVIQKPNRRRNREEKTQRLSFAGEDATPKSKLPLARRVLATEGQPLTVQCNSEATASRPLIRGSNQTKPDTEKIGFNQNRTTTGHPPDLGETQTGNTTGTRRRKKKIEKSEEKNRSPHTYTTVIAPTPRRTIT